MCEEFNTDVYVHPYTYNANVCILTTLCSVVGWINLNSDIYCFIKKKKNENEKENKNKKQKSTQGYNNVPLLLLLFGK